MNLVPYNPNDKVTLAERSGVKLSDASRKQIGIMISKVILILGLSANSIPDNDPDFPKLDFLRDLIRENLGEWTDEEVVYAMKLAATGILSVDLKLYDGQLSVLFFGNVMTAYRQHKRQHKAAIQYLIPEKTVELSQQEQQNIMLNCFILNYTEYKLTKTIIDLGNINYSYADRLGLFSKFAVPLESADTKQQAEELYKQNQKSIIPRTLSWIVKDAIRFNIENPDANAVEFKRIEKELKLSQLYDRMIDADFDMNTLQPNEQQTIPQ